MVVFVALAAITALAFAVPTVAVAEETTLCSGDGSGCGVTHIHETTLSGAKAKLSSHSGTVSCDVLFLGDALGTSGEPLVIHGNFTYTNCGSCTVTETSPHSTISLFKEGQETAKVTREGTVFVDCGKDGIQCEYDGKGLVGTGMGPLLSSETNGSISLSNQVIHPLKVEGSRCPEESKLDITTTPLSATYISKPPTSLCSIDEESPVCKSENQLKTIDYKDKALEVLTNLINVNCEGLASGSVGEPGGILEVKPELTFTGCSGGCFVTSVAGPGKVVLERSKSEEAKATAEGFEIFVKCGMTIKCLLGPGEMAGTALGALTTGDNGHLAFSKVSTGKGEGLLCPSEAGLDALFVASSATYIG
jgi:hypothetical protein